MDNSVSKEDKDCVRNPIKKVHKICDKCLIIIDNSLVERLRIGENETWVEQEQTENGILLRILRYPSIKED
jgi:hypothetical protein